MKPSTRILLLSIAVSVCLSHGVSYGSIETVGDLNIINDASNPSDGLRYLDMSFSNELTLSAALVSAQGTYANARLATKCGVSKPGSTYYVVENLYPNMCSKTDWHGSC